MKEIDSQYNKVVVVCMEDFVCFCGGVHSDLQSVCDPQKVPEALLERVDVNPCLILQKIFYCALRAVRQTRPL